MSIEYDVDAALEEVIEFAWLDPYIGDPTKIKTGNIFETEDELFSERPDFKILDMMRRPEYFHWTVKKLFGMELALYQVVILQELWFRPFPMLIAARGGSKTSLLGLYAVLRGLLMQGSKVIICGSVFRQSKMVFEHCELLWNNSPIIQKWLKGLERQGPKRDIDRVQMGLGKSTIIGLPIGNGEKIRGFRANCIIADEFKSHNPDIFENVISGFGSTSQNPILSMKEAAKRKVLAKRGIVPPEDNRVNKHNQVILSGTAYYQFNHFYRYYDRYRRIIESGGDVNRLKQALGESYDENNNWKDYSVIQIPVDCLPEGFMDSKNIARSRATFTESNFLMEFMAVFAADSSGFYRRSLIESCVITNNNTIDLGAGPINFSAMLRGGTNRRYIYGVDPASEADNFSIVILEAYNDHARVVYCWTTTRQKFKDKAKVSLAAEKDFYGYCVRKIRDLMIAFPCERIMLDSQGGGIAILEGLHDPGKMKEGEAMIWPIIDPNKEQDTDKQPGLHIIEPCQFSRAEWVAAANHGMRKDFEDKALIFPFFDQISIELALQEDKRLRDAGDPTRLYDSLEDCVLEIEELKDELASIVHTQTGVTGRDHWDTPEIKLADGKKGRMRKDRYSALLMANMGARQNRRELPRATSDTYGGFAHMIKGKSEGQIYKTGCGINADASWYGGVVKRKGR